MRTITATIKQNRVIDEKTSEKIQELLLNTRDLYQEYWEFKDWVESAPIDYDDDSDLYYTLHNRILEYKESFQDSFDILVTELNKIDKSLILLSCRYRDLYTYDSYNNDEEQFVGFDESGTECGIDFEMIKEIYILEKE